MDAKKTAVVPAKNNAVSLAKEFKITVGELQTIQNTIAKGATVDELKLFLFQAKRTGLDPFSRQIHLVKRGDTAVIQTGIDGYRTVAERTGKYAGNDEPVFELDGKKPIKASVTVWKMVEGQRVGFTASARWDEYFPGEKMGFMWKSKPFLMLGKCAEAQALRKAFPNDLSGLYIKEELDKEEKLDGDYVPEKPAHREIVMTAIKFAETGGEERMADLRARMEANKFTDEEKKIVEDIITERFPTKPENLEDKQPPEPDTKVEPEGDEISPEDNPFPKKKK